MHIILPVFLCRLIFALDELTRRGGLLANGSVGRRRGDRQRRASSPCSCRVTGLPCRAGTAHAGNFVLLSFFFRPLSKYFHPTFPNFTHDLYRVLLGGLKVNKNSCNAKRFSVLLIQSPSAEQSVCVVIEDSAPVLLVELILKVLILPSRARLRLFIAGKNALGPWLCLLRIGTGKSE